ncbi:MAG: hypothetical protein V4638_11590 [Bacteroidota bacterium]
MKKSIFILSVLFLTSCGSTDANEEGTQEKVKTETSEKLKEAQDVNTELEEIDGELDSLLNSLK